MPLFPQSNSAFPSYRQQSSTVPNPYAGMSINFPNMPLQANAPQGGALIGVHGFDSVKQFPHKPNETVALFDLDADFGYIIDTDVNNQPSYKIFSFTTISEEEYRELYAAAIAKDTDVPTKEEYNNLLKRNEELEKRIDRLEKEMNSNAQQPVRSQRTNNGYAAAKTANPAVTKSSKIPNVSTAKPAIRSDNSEDVSNSQVQQESRT